MNSAKQFIITALLAITALFTTRAANVSDTLYIDGSVGRLYTIVDRQADTTRRVPVVILCHGFSGNCNAWLMQCLSQRLLERGMATVRFDLNGHGNSDGEFKNMTVLNEIADLKAVIAWTRQQPWTKDIALVGHSQGGVVVGMTSGELGKKIIKAEVLLAPAAVLRDDALKGNTMGAFYDPWNFNDEYIRLPFSPESGPLLLGKDYIKSAITLPIYETSARYKGPALIIQGTYDRIVPYTYAERYHDVIRKSTLRLITGEDHGFSQTTPATSVEVADWLRSILLK